MSVIQVEFKMLSHAEGIDIPSYATPNSAGVDLRAAINDSMIIKSMQRELIPTGLSIALPAGYEGQVRPRSGFAVKQGVTVINSPGTIDADYRGEIKVCLINLGQGILTISRGDRIAQLIISQVFSVSFNKVLELSETERGEGGFGSTGSA